MSDCNWKPDRKFAIEIGLAFLVSIIGLLPLTLWSVLDHSLPPADGARHSLIARDYAELFTLVKPHEPLRYKLFWDINHHYPPLVHLLEVPFYRAGLGFPAPERIVALLLGLVANFSIYALTRLLSRDSNNPAGSRIGAALSVLLLNALPLVAITSRTGMLDYPAMAATALAILAISLIPRLKFNSSRFLAYALAAICLFAKNSVILFVLPSLICLLMQKPPRHRLLAPALILAPLLPLLLWALLPLVRTEGLHWRWGNPDETNLFLSTLVAISHPFPRTALNLAGVVTGLPGLLSPLLLPVFLVIPFLDRRWLQSKFCLPILLPSTGIILACLLSAYPMPGRYILPGLIPLVAITGAALGTSLKKKLERRSILAGIAVTLILFAFVWQVGLAATPIESQDDFRLCSREDASTGCPAIARPVPEGDPLGQRWIWQMIEKDPSHKEKQLEDFKKIENLEAPEENYEWLVIMPSTPVLNTYTISLCKPPSMRGVRVTSIRHFTNHGDRVEKQDCKPRFVLISTSDNQGVYFDTEESAKNFEDFARFVCDSEQYRLLGAKQIGDGSSLKLYSLRLPAEQARD
ncbi:MAG: glycosyltransferase family 39 protein [Cyanobacteria bacterium HKST-UBA02]|nr:glycosyltransferase family 39 protein [Cyanobacteria bacterium HKST-UBA02]